MKPAPRPLSDARDALEHGRPTASSRSLSWGTASREILPADRLYVRTVARAIMALRREPSACRFDAICWAMRSARLEGSGAATPSVHPARLRDDDARASAFCRATSARPARSAAERHIAAVLGGTMVGAAAMAAGDLRTEPGQGQADSGAQATSYPRPRAVRRSWSRFSRPRALTQRPLPRARSALIEVARQYSCERVIFAPTRAVVAVSRGPMVGGYRFARAAIPAGTFPNIRARD